MPLEFIVQADFFVARQGGGGGGSGYVNPDIFKTFSMSNGAKSGNGQVRITPVN